MAWCALGDSAWLFEPLDGGGVDRREAVLGMARLLESEPIPGVTDVVTAYETVAVHFDPADGEEVLERLQALAPPEAFGGAAAPAAKVVEIPVAYGGTDLEEVAERLGRSPDEIAALHSGASYQVAAIGFSPGFPYLTGMPEQLRIGRKASPGKVEAGSVAIAGGQAGIYPFDSPGGWWVLGRTPARLFDPGRDEPSLLKAGDRVRFVPTDSPPRVDIAEAPPMHGSCEVLDPGGLCVIEDLGRPGFQHAGVSPGGAADPVTALNTLVPETAKAAVAGSTSVASGAVTMDARTKAKMQGYEGEACGDCGNYTLVRNGTCMKCNTCGSTSGCS